METTRDEMKALAKKIQIVMSKVTNVAKDGRNDFQQYDYVTEAAVVAKIRDAMIDVGLVVIPNATSCSHATVERSTKEGLKKTGLTTIGITYTIVDVDTGASVDARVYGEGADTQDKGVYKAMTGCSKYFLLKTFMIPTGDDPEGDMTIEYDTVSDAVEPSGGGAKPEKAPAREAAPPPPKDSGDKKAPATLNDENLKRIEAIHKLLSDNNIDANEVLCDVTSFPDKKKPGQKVKWLKTLAALLQKIEDGKVAPKGRLFYMANDYEKAAHSLLGISANQIEDEEHIPF